MVKARLKIFLSEFILYKETESPLSHGVTELQQNLRSDRTVQKEKNFHLKSDIQLFRSSKAITRVLSLQRKMILYVD